MMRTIQEAYYLREVADTINIKAVHYCCLLNVLHWHKQRLIAKGTRLDSNGQGTTNGLKRAIQTQFSNHHHLIQTIRIYLLCCSQNTDGNGKIKATSHLAHICRCEVHSYLLARKGETAILQGCSYALMTFLDGIVRQAYEHKPYASGTVHFDCYLLGIQSLNRCTIDFGKHYLRVMKEVT